MKPVIQYAINIQFGFDLFFIFSAENLQFPVYNFQSE